MREFIATVEAWDRQTSTLVRIDTEDCGFGYRDSLFKREPNRHIITAVEFLLPRSGTLRTDYAGVGDELVAMGVETNPLTVAEAVARLRTRKLPNPAVIGNAGSFFKNPMVTAEIAHQLAQDNPGLPSWPGAEGKVKLPAAWLIEACGLKGLREGDAAVSSQHSLVLVNHGRATGAQIWALAQRVQSRVAERFGLRLEPEPIVI